MHWTARMGRESRSDWLGAAGSDEGRSTWRFRVIEHCRKLEAIPI